ncbi:MAG: transcription termination factor Rho [Desulfarculus sp.]|nr:transcription termination factor Rho [Desulfarculus sp.]
MAEKQAKEKALEKMTAKELRELALTIDGIVGVHAMNKAELIAAIKQARGIVDDGKQVDTGAIRAAKSAYKALKEKRDAARETASRSELDIMRKKLSRLKKQTRRLTKAA